MKKHQFTSYPAEKHPKCSKFAITDMRQKLVDFFYCNPLNNFANLGSFAKVSVPVRTIIPRYVKIIRNGNFVNFFVCWLTMAKIF